MFLRRGAVMRNMKYWNLIKFILIVVAVIIFLTWLTGKVGDKMSEYSERVKEVHNEIENYVETEVINIVALNYETDIKGSFILGFGNMSTKKYYVAYKVLDDGGKQLIEMDAEDVIIYDSLGNDEQAYLEIDKNYYGRETAKRLYVPQNTIIENYELKIE